MTNYSTEKLIELSETADTLSGQGQGFKVGDVVESKKDIVAPEGSKGIVILEYVEDSPPDYDICWYRSGVGGVFREDLRYCRGTRDKSLCEQCEYHELCPYIGEIVRCDISEFGEWRTEGTVDYEICQQRKCPHLNMCRSKKWLPGTG